jgi:uncharacterized protein YbjT (DUF2867 family)
VTDRKVLILGADGFIGRHIAFALRAAGWTVVACARNPQRLARMGFATCAIDLQNPRFHVADGWTPHVAGITHVVNAAGLLTGTPQAMEAVHSLAPKALYTALGHVNGVLISAVGIDADTPFAHHRRLGESAASDAGLTCLRAGLVLADTSYGGSSLGRALAAFPFVTPLVGGGTQPINPIHVDDLADNVRGMLEAPMPSKIVDIGGAQTLTQADMLAAFRTWLGLPAARPVTLPMSVARALGKCGDFLRMGPISQTAVVQLNTSLIAGNTKPLSPQSITPRGFSDFLWARPAGTQDLWQARLYLLKPLLRLTLAFLWLVSAGIGLFLPSSAFLPVFADTGLSDTALTLLARGGGIVDLLIGIALLRNWVPKRLALFQLLMVGGYTVGITWLNPALWLLPFGGLLKNIPILALLLIHFSLIEER